MAHDEIGDAADEEPPDWSTAVGAHHYQVDALGFGRADDGLSRVALPDEERGVSAVNARLPDHGLGTDFLSGAQLVDSALGSDAVTQAGTDHAGHQETGPQAHGDLDRLFRRGRRGWSKIGGEHDHPDLASAT
jgi:hypothetical protein